jgi:Bacterial protein of unknown function (DUF899)
VIFSFDYHVSFTPQKMAACKVEYNYQVTSGIVSRMSEAPGISVFFKDGDKIYHTYSTYTRGLDMLNVAYHSMDLVPKGRGTKGHADRANGFVAMMSIPTDGPRSDAVRGGTDQTVSATWILSGLSSLPTKTPRSCKRTAHRESRGPRDAYRCPWLGGNWDLTVGFVSGYVRMPREREMRR